MVAAAAILTHLCLGSVYAWSMFSVPICQATGWKQPQVTWAFSAAIATLGLTAAFGGPVMQRLGPRKCVGLAATLFGVGMAGAGFATWQHSLPLLYLLFGVVGGIGLGMGYAPPVAALLKWFPDKRGLATGMAVCGFGLGALVATKLAEPLLARWGVVSTFYILGIGYLTTIFVASRLMRLPAEGWRPAGWMPKVGAAADDAQLSLLQALAGQRFWLLWLVFFINICAGIMLIALAKPMGKDVAHLSDVEAGWLVAIMGLFNGLGRLGWSSMSDKLGRSATLFVMLLLQVGLFALLTLNPGALLFGVCVWVIISCYGGGFAITPAFIADMFGTRSAGTIYGCALTAWSAAALTSPPLGAYLRETTHGYGRALYVCTTMLALALILNGVLALLLRKARRDQAAVRSLEVSAQAS
jgi:MFS transporter, OFA family, oxalate/formate antiporter